MTPTDLIRRIRWPVTEPASDPEAFVSHEWLVTNGLGGYASGTVPGVVTRRYHGFLIAALPAPLGRVVMLSQAAECVSRRDGRPVEAEEAHNAREAGPPLSGKCLTEFRLENGLPVWRYDVGGVIIEKRLFLTHGQNTVHLLYDVLDGADSIVLAIRPSVNFRSQDAPVSEPLAWPYEFRAIGECHEIVLKDGPFPPLRLLVRGTEATFTLKGTRLENVLYPVEESRGYHWSGTLWSPGYYELTLAKGERASLVASTEPFASMTALSPDEALEAERERRRRLVSIAVPEARIGVAAELVLAADQFIITPAGRVEDAARARAAGEDVRTIIAGYHWFTDWGRDTMISLEGLTLVTGRHREADYILRTFAHYVRHGLIPNMFPEGQNTGLYHTADATLWFFHAISRYLAYAHDVLTLEGLYPLLKNIVTAHRRGTHFGIHVDPRDGLLVQGAAGYQLTWMDAKVDDWVVTPRRGKAVEINALWYNALCLMAEWAGELGDERAARDYAQAAAQVKHSFNERFWYEAGRYLYDVVETEGTAPGAPGVPVLDDTSFRPNQLFAISLPHAVLARERWKPVVDGVRERLLTPVGLRSLSPDDPSFKSRYFGDLRARDAAYHQGTVWGWLLGPFVDAWLCVYPDDVHGARRAVDGFLAHLDDACVGSVSEVFDADPPFAPRGCIAQAWSVAELLRVWVKLNS
jgi:predicted glycogen debranching enzyme